MHSQWNKLIAVEKVMKRDREVVAHVDSDLQKIDEI